MLSHPLWQPLTLLIESHMIMGPAEETTALIVPEESAQKIRFKLEKLKIWDATYKLKKLEGSGQVAIPVDARKESYSVIIKTWPDLRLARMCLPISKKVKARHNSPAALLNSEIKLILNRYEIDDKFLCEVPTKWEKHDDLVIIPAQAFSSPEWSIVGHVLINHSGSHLWHVVGKCLECKRLARHSPVADDGFRSSKVTMLLGDNGQVEHVDNGIKYSYDVTKCMFSSGNITEKIRVASLDCTQETVVDLYAGIGYFSLPYLIHAKAFHVHACEWNPNAIEALKCNLLINGVSERCTVHEGDNRLLQLSSVADRVNLGLIPSSEEGWPVAVQVLKQSGGVLHVHGNVTAMSPKRLDDETDVCDAQLLNGMEKCDNFQSSCHQLNKVLLQNTSEVKDYKLTDTQDKMKRVFSSEKTDNNSEKDIRDPNSGGFQIVCNVADNVKGNDQYNTEPKRTGKGNELVACKDWSLYVQSRIKSLLESQKGGEWAVKELHIEVIKSYAPHVVHAVLDLQCRPVRCEGEDNCEGENV